MAAVAGGVERSVGSRLTRVRTPRLDRTFWGGIGAAPGPLLFLVVAVTYFALAQYVIWLNDPVHVGAGYWPAAGLTLVALLLTPARRWAWVLGAVVVAELGGDALHDYPLAASLWWAAGNTAEPLVAALLLRRFASGGRLAPLDNLVWFLLAGVLVGPFVGAVIGSIGTASEFGIDHSEVLLKWWSGDGLGVLVVAPLFLAFRERTVPDRSRLEMAAVAVVVVAVSLLVFRNWQSEWDLVVPYLVFPLLMWASVRFGIRGAAIAGFAVAEIANLTTALGYGPFELADRTGGNGLTVLQVFLGCALTAGLVIATLVNHSVDRAKAHAQQRFVLDALQAAVLPAKLPVASGLTLAARYAPAADEAMVKVGGDWYDAFELPDGSIALVVGDVAGHDLSAAVAMGHLRNGLRSLLLEVGDPARVMVALDRQLAGIEDGLLATALIVIHHDGELRWVNAGHPPLLHASADGAVRLLEGDPDPMLGIGHGNYRVHRAQLGRGDVVVGYTDGLVEHRTWALEDAFANLTRLVAASPTRDPEALCDLLLAEALGGRAREDDVCVLALRRVG